MTQLGRVVYNRKKHVFNLKAASRIVANLDLDAEDPADLVQYGFRLLTNIPRLLFAVFRNVPFADIDESRLAEIGLEIIRAFWDGFVLRGSVLVELIAVSVKAILGLK
jgi:hypothetical protein